MWDVTITAEGRRVHDEILVPVRAHERATFEVLAPDQQRRLEDLLHALAPRGRYPDVLKEPHRANRGPR